MPEPGDQLRALTVERLLEAYSAGIFPMASSRTGAIAWYVADPRTILELEEFHVSRSLLRRYRSGRFEVRVDTAFVEVMRGCQERPQTWISEEFIAAYRELAALGRAHSVEAWRGGRLVGGLYGVHLGGAFFGESMFHRESDASKVCLVYLVERLKANGFALLDCQMMTELFRRFGARQVPFAEYRRRLAAALQLCCPFP